MRRTDCLPCKVRRLSISQYVEGNIHMYTEGEETRICRQTKNRRPTKLTLESSTKGERIMEVIVKVERYSEHTECIADPLLHPAEWQGKHNNWIG